MKRIILAILSLALISSFSLNSFAEPIGEEGAPPTDETVYESVIPSGETAIAEIVTAEIPPEIITNPEISHLPEFNMYPEFTHLPEFIMNPEFTPIE